MRTLPRAMAHGTQSLYRGIREDSREDGYSFWAVDRDYAESYGGEIIEGQLSPTATILDLTSVIQADGWIHGGDLENLLPGLAEALGVDAETEIECERLWDAAGDDLNKAVTLLDANGFDGFRWVEQDRRETYMLLH